MEERALDVESRRKAKIGLRYSSIYIKQTSSLKQVASFFLFLQVFFFFFSSFWLGRISRTIVRLVSARDFCCGKKKTIVC